MKHDMFTAVLNKKDLSKAGDLFQISDAEILSNLTDNIKKIIDVINQPDYGYNLNDQSVVEICITRITSAIRENASLEEQGLALVLLLQTCLNHNLRPTSPDTVPPHAKITAEVIACIFLHFQQDTVMREALAVTVKLLHKGNTELSRSISSYLSLASIHSASLVAQHTHTIVDSVIAGNYSLSRILPTLYSEAQDSLHRHVLPLVSLLPQCSHADCVPLLQLFSLVAAHRPALFENSVPQLLECLPHRDILLSTLQVVLLLGHWRPALLTPYMGSIMAAVDGKSQALGLGLQVVLVGGRASKELARVALSFASEQLTAVDKSCLAEVLREVGALVCEYPDAAGEELLVAVRNCHSAATAHTALVTLLTARSWREESKATGATTRVRASNSTCVGIEGLAGKQDLLREQGRASELPLSRLPSEGLYQQNLVVQPRHNKYQKHSGAIVADSTWRCGTRLGTSSNRSMPRLNAGVGSSTSRLGSSSIQLNKSLARSITALSTQQQQPARPLSSPHPAAMLAAYNNTCTTIDPSSPYAFCHVSSALPGKTSFTLQSFSSYVGSGCMKQSSGRLSSLGSGNGVSATSDLQQAIQAVASGPQRLPHLFSRDYSAALEHSNKLMPLSDSCSSSSAASKLLPLSENCSNNSAVSKLLVTDFSSPTVVQTSSLDTATNVALNDRSEPFPVQGVSVHVFSSRCSSTNTIKDSEVQANNSLTSLSLLSAATCTTTSVTTTAAAPPLVTCSSGAVTSTSSGSVDGSAGSLSAVPVSSATLSVAPLSAASLPAASGSVSAVSHSLSSSKFQSRRLRGRPASAAAMESPMESLGASLLRNSACGLPETQRASVFEPQTMKDTIQHFCEKHRDKIKAYMQKVFVKLPLPVKCTIEVLKKRKYAKLSFSCQCKGQHCLYNTHLYCISVRHPRVWIHLMFLALQARSPSALSSRDTQISALRKCWDTVNNDVNVPFLTLVTAAFPSAKDIDGLMHELRSNRFFDVFEYNGLEQQWGCFLCNHPDRAQEFVQEDTPVIEGQLKEKKSKWKLFKKWRTRYFTLSGAHLSYRGEREDRAEDKGDIDVQQIRSVKISKSGRQIPKAFEIFTDNKSFVLKAKDSSNAEEWVRCLSIVVAQQNSHRSSHHSAPAHHRSNPGGMMSSSNRVYNASSSASLSRPLMYSGTPVSMLSRPVTSSPLSSAASLPQPSLHSPASSTLPPGLHLVRSRV